MRKQLKQLKGAPAAKAEKTRKLLFAKLSASEESHLLRLNNLYNMCTTL
jgi:hypothetical protein